MTLDKWDIVVILSLVVAVLSLGLLLSYFMALGIAKTMNPGVGTYDPRLDPMCDPITGEMKPDACKVDWSRSGMARSGMCFSQCYISRNATVETSKIPLYTNWEDACIEEDYIFSGGVNVTYYNKSCLELRSKQGEK